MPTFDYQCSNCKKTYDVFHKVREVEEDVVCPHCSSTKHVRLLSAPAISMNGLSASGFSSDPAPSCSDGSCCGGACGMN